MSDYKRLYIDPTHYWQLEDYVQRTGEKKRDVIEHLIETLPTNDPIFLCQTEREPMQLGST